MITKFSKAELEFLMFRLEATDALIDVMVDDEDDAIAAFGSALAGDLQMQVGFFGALETKLRFGCDLTQLTAMERWVIVDSVEGSNLIAMARDEQDLARGSTLERDRVNRNVYVNTLRSARSVARKLAAAGITVTLCM